jgi:cyclopropane fatty-acyl-phospholipid synthase-like methyltransferase
MKYGSLSTIEQKMLDTGFLANCTRVAEGFWELPTGICNEALNSFRSWDGVRLTERAKIELTTSYYETKLYEKTIRKVISKIPEGMILELGAGDGRITRMLLDNWCGSILACECNKPALERLHASLSAEDRQRLLLLCGSIEDLQLKYVSFSAIVAIEVLHYLGASFNAFFARLASALEPNGKLVHSEATAEGWLLYCLAIDDWDGALIAAEQHLVENRFPGFTPDEIKSVYEKSGLRLIETAQTPLANILLVNRLNRSNLPEERKLEIARRIRTNAEALSIPRCVIYTAEPIR